MTIFWAIVAIILIALIFIEPLGQILIKRKETIVATECYLLQYHNGDNRTNLYMVQDEDDNLFTSEVDLPIYVNIEVSYKGFSIPQLSIFPRITEFNVKLD